MFYEQIIPWCFFLSQHQDWTTARYIRFRFLKLHTLTADLIPGIPAYRLLDSSETRRVFFLIKNLKIVIILWLYFRREYWVTALTPLFLFPLLQYFYSIKDISIGGQCICFGHARDCPTDEEGIARCQCAHNTCGESCERCCPLFNQKPWKAGTLTHPSACEGNFSSFIFMVLSRYVVFPQINQSTNPYLKCIQTARVLELNFIKCQLLVEFRWNYSHLFSRLSVSWACRWMPVRLGGRQQPAQRQHHWKVRRWRRLRQLPAQHDGHQLRTLSGRVLPTPGSGQIQPHWMSAVWVPGFRYHWAVYCGWGVHGGWTPTRRLCVSRGIRRAEVRSLRAGISELSRLWALSV